MSIVRRAGIRSLPPAVAAPSPDGRRPAVAAASRRAGTVLAVLVAAARLAWAGPAEEAEGWQLRAQDEAEGIEVYQRSRADGLPEFLGVTRVSSRLSALVAVLQDTAAMPRWVYRLREAQRLEGSGRLQGRTRVLTSMPWPLNDREAIVDWRLRQTLPGGEVVIEGRQAADRLPPTETLVRMPQFASSWRFIPQGGGMVEVRFTGYGHLGGNIGAGPLRSFVDAAVWIAPMETLRGLRRMIALPEYRNAVPGVVQEPD